MFRLVKPLLVAAMLMTLSVGVACAQDDDPFPTGNAEADWLPRVDRDRDVSYLKLEVIEPAPLPEDLEKESAEQSIRRALEARVRVELQDAPLGQFCRELNDRLHVPIVLHRSLEDSGIGSDTPFTFPAREMAADHMLDRVLDPTDLSWMVRRDVIMICTPEEVEENRVVGIYDVSDLVMYQDKQGRYDFDFDSLICTITSTIDSESWTDVGGSGTIEPFESHGLQVLVIKQRPRNHREIESLLANLRARVPDESGSSGLETDSLELPSANRPKVFRDILGPRVINPDRNEIAIRKLLEEKIDIDMENGTLGQFVGRIEQHLGTPVRLHKSTEEAGVGEDTPVALSLSGVSARTVLEVALDRLDLTWMYDKDAMVICTPEAAEENRIVRLYDVSDLTLFSALGSLHPKHDADPIIRMITCTIQPENWSEFGGSGTIEPFESRGRIILVIRQTARIHQELEELLTKLRKIRREGNGLPLPKREYVYGPQSNS